VPQSPTGLPQTKRFSPLPIKPRQQGHFTSHKDKPAFLMPNPPNVPDTFNQSKVPEPLEEAERCKDEDMGANSCCDIVRAKTENDC
jgi:hypothetical protein